MDIKEDKKIVWHPKASDDFRQILVYCRDEFGRNTALKVREKILKSVSRLSQNPLLGVKEPILENVGSLEYRSLALKRTKIIYTVHEDYVYIHILWNTMKDTSGIKDTLINRK